MIVIINVFGISGFVKYLYSVATENKKILQSSSVWNVINALNKKLSFSVVSKMLCRCFPAFMLLIIFPNKGTLKRNISANADSKMITTINKMSFENVILFRYIPVYPSKSVLSISRCNQIPMQS